MDSGAKNVDPSHRPWIPGSRVKKIAGLKYSGLPSSELVSRRRRVCIEVGCHDTSICLSRILLMTGRIDIICLLLAGRAGPGR